MSGCWNLISAKMLQLSWEEKMQESFGARKKEEEKLEEGGRSKKSEELVVLYESKRKKTSIKTNWEHHPLTTREEKGGTQTNGRTVLIKDEV